jgi:hypothetical protein
MISSNELLRSCASFYVKLEKSRVGWMIALLVPETELWLEIRREEALTIEPETAEVRWEYGDPFDPYSVCEEFPWVAKQLAADLVPTRHDHLGARPDRHRGRAFVAR